MKKLIEYLKKDMPVYLTVALLVAWTALLVGCSIIPTHYTTNEDQRNIVRQNTGLQIEFMQRFEKMDPDMRLEFLKENIKFAVLIEEIICGSVSSVAARFLDKGD
jgi:hypothetical protein